MPIASRRKARLLRALIVFAVAIAAASPAEVPRGDPAPPTSCSARYDGAVLELRATRPRACLAELDALTRRCVDEAHASVRAKAHFLRAEVLLLGGAWDEAAAAARDAAAAGTRESGHTPTRGEHLANRARSKGARANSREQNRNRRFRPDAVRSLLETAERAKLARDDIAADVASGKSERAMRRATDLLRAVAPQAVDVLLLRARAPPSPRARAAEPRRT
jgi:hypothetical protein